MSIKSRAAYYAVCDCCGNSIRSFYDYPALLPDEKEVKRLMYFHNWLELNGLDLCADCWTVNDDDQHVRSHVVHPADGVSES